MSYMFAFSLLYYRYNRDCVIRVYADNHFIDEICLQDDIKLKARSTTIRPWGRDSFGPLNYCPIQILPEKLFMFEIDDSFLHKTIRLEIENDHNNYTNGFMTKYAHIRFGAVFLIPKCLLQFSNWKKIERFHTGNFRESNNYPMWFIDGPYTEFLGSNKDAITIYNSALDIGDSIFLSERGGSFTIDFKLFKKHKVLHIGKPRPGRFRIDRAPARILEVFKSLNIYNEDQRSNRT